MKFYGFVTKFCQYELRVLIVRYNVRYILLRYCLYIGRIIDLNNALYFH